ncbi:MAG: hypothetical protein Fur0037_00120 [Planctomycetota bacterium]
MTFLRGSILEWRLVASLGGLVPLVVLVLVAWLAWAQEPYVLRSSGIYLLHDGVGGAALVLWAVLLVGWCRQASQRREAGWGRGWGIWWWISGATGLLLHAFLLLLFGGIVVIALDSISGLGGRAVLPTLARFGPAVLPAVPLAVAAPGLSLTPWPDAVRAPLVALFLLLALAFLGPFPGEAPAATYTPAWPLLLAIAGSGLFTGAASRIFSTPVDSCASASSATSMATSRP